MTFGIFIYCEKNHKIDLCQIRRNLDIVFTETDFYLSIFGSNIIVKVKIFPVEYILFDFINNC